MPLFLRTHLNLLWTGLLFLSAGVLCVNAQETGSTLPLRYAKNFTIDYLDGAKVVTVMNTWRGDEGNRTRYLLVREGADLSKLPKDLPRITIPSQRVVVGPTTYLPHFVALGVDERIVGVTDPRLINTPEIQQRITAGQIKKVGHSATLNQEILISTQPDLVISSTTGDARHDTHQKLQRENIPIIVTAAYMESTALGRAEWIKFISAFFDMEAEAERVFDEIEGRYLELAKTGRNTRKKPTVFFNLPWSGTWYTPGGNSYKASFIKDAGGAYLWDDEQTTGSLPLDLETVFARAVDADFWLDTRDHDTLNELISTDARYASLKAVQEGQAYNNNAMLNKHGGNAIWERGALYPDEVLADLIHILHPELLPEHKLTFYHKLD